MVCKGLFFSGSPTSVIPAEDQWNVGDVIIVSVVLVVLSLHCTTSYMPYKEMLLTLLWYLTSSKKLNRMK